MLLSPRPLITVEVVMKRSLLLLTVLLGCAPLLVAQRSAPVPDLPIPVGRPEDVGLSSDRLARLKTAMQEYVDRRDVAGVVTLVARHGRVAHFESVGYRDAEARAPMTPDTIFRQASMTKPIVAVAALMLFEQGRFQLSDPISKWLPEFKDMKVLQPGLAGAYTTGPARTPITIRHLLTHTNGLQSNDGVLLPAYEKIAPRTVPKDTVGAFVTRLAGMPLNFEPGSAWHYGGAGNGLAVVGRLVEVISEQSLDQFLSERILRPLKMNDTYFYLPEGKLPRFAATYRPDRNKKIELDEAPTANSLFFRERTYFSGTGGLVSTASDYLRFQLMLLNGGELDGVRILGRKTVELMSSNHTGNFFVVNRPGYGFGLGVAVLVDLGASGQLGSEGMFGWGGAFNTITFVDPKEDMIGIMMSQVRPNDHLNIRRDFQTLVYQALVSPQPNVGSSK
jgi:CubicO group peptidase (beta-lactamase class C family)